MKKKGQNNSSGAASKPPKAKKGLFSRFIKCLVIFIIFVIILAALATAALKLYTYHNVHIREENGIDEKTYVTLGGQQQYLLIRGKDKSNPVMIWLHGGPASPDASISYAYAKYFDDEYTLICWDQRGCGRTYFKNGDSANVTATFTNALSDLDELVDYALARFNKKSVILIGHSYGTVLGSRYALSHPEKIAAYIAVGQVVNAIEADTLCYEDSLSKAASRGDDTYWLEKAYKEFKNNPTVVNVMKLRQYTSKYHKAEKEANPLWISLKSPDTGINDIRWFLKQIGNLEQYERLNLQLFEYLLSCDVRTFGTEYQIPVGFISGSDDWTTPVKLSEDYYRSLSAPQKYFETISGCGHSPQTDDPEQFSATLKRVLSDSLKIETK